MSFQGDVGGIGLAELLQSLARGRREGVLTLNAGKRDVCTLGLETGVLYLLPEPGEDAGIWKERARQAWVDRLDHRMDGVRTSEIARAHRIERLYQLLDSEGVAFRFDPRSLPTRSEGPLELTSKEAASAVQHTVGAPQTPQVYCEGVSVEFLLLEYARLNDEADSHEGPLGIFDDNVPARTGPETTGGAQGFLNECDGSSTVAEIADRLACPIRQGRLLVAEALRKGTVTLVEPAELLELARTELHEGRIHRTGARLAAWVRTCEPGPSEPDAAAMLAREWDEDRLGPVLNRMATPLVRRMVRRIDHALDDPQQELRHWRELQRIRRHDGIIEMHRISCEYRIDEDADTPSLRELLEVARGFRELGCPRRAASILHMAAARNPSSNAARLDIGVGFVAAGMVDEATSWIIDTARVLIEAGEPEKALAPLRTLIEAAPERRDARRLVIRARNMAMRRQIIRRHSTVGIAVLVALALGAWVQIHVERRTERQYEEVSSRLDSPVEAQELFERYFSDDDSERILTLSALIRERRREIETRLRTDWYKRFQEAQGECSFGDPVKGLERALAIPNPPVLVTVTEPWPLVVDLFNGMAARFESEVHDLGEPQLDAPQQERDEDALTTQMKELVAGVEKAGRPSLTASFHSRIEALLEELERRKVRRREDAEERDRLDVLEQQELLYSAAKAHTKAGDLERARLVYAKLLQTDESGKLAEVLKAEIEAVNGRYHAVENARAFAMEGRHAEAAEELEKHLERPHTVPLPWKLETYPAGARVYLPDGSESVTPLLIESCIGEHLDIRIETNEHRAETLSVDTPGDHFIWLSRTPERTWRTGGRVEALPVAVGSDHIVCDRAGQIARLGSGTRPRWERQLGSLGGVAHSPVFLSQRSGFLLTVTEDGEAWIIDSRNGELEGPLPLESAPASGPTPTADGVSVTLRDGRIATWSQRLKPDELKKGQPPVEPEIDSVASSRTFTAGLAVLRSPSGGELTLESPWNEWRVTIRSDVFLVERKGAAGRGFAVERQAEWYYVAWEAPHGALPSGRLWISDGAGLRSYVP